MNLLAQPSALQLGLLRPVVQQPSWRGLVYEAVRRLDPSSDGISLRTLHLELRWHPKTSFNPRWKNEIRRGLEEHPLLEQIRLRVWRVRPGA